MDDATERFVVRRFLNRVPMKHRVKQMLAVVAISVAMMHPLAPTRAAAAQLPAPSADLVAGISAYNDGDFATARKRLNAAVANGDPEAMVNLGYMHARGHGVRSDPSFALELYRRAASAGDAEAMNAVGFRYQFANPPDFESAAKWFCRAVLLGNPRAMNNAAILFYRGEGVPYDREEANNLWRQAMERGHLNAQTNLAQELATDTTQPEATRQSGIAMLQDAAAHGDAKAQDIVRRWGDTHHYPPGKDMALVMRLEPRDPKPGSSRICGDLIS